LPAFASAGPGVRIARLSVAQGDVQIDRNSGDGWEQAVNNMPIVGGARLFAGDNSRAEIEFEDGSSVRLAGPAQVSVSQLSLAADGTPVTHIEIDSGMVYVNARLNHPADFQIIASTGESFAVTKPSRLRFKAGEQVASLSVIEGEVQIAKNGGDNSTLQAGQSYNYILGQPGSAVRSASVPPQTEDSWDQQRDTYNDQNAAAGAQYSGSADPNAPGVADLGAYGNYANIPDCGDCWQPNGVGPDWNPYDNGAWSYYDDWGWTFVSGYPWGWAPFYYGNWFYAGGRGWWWRPGGPHGGWGTAGGWRPLPHYLNAPAHGFSAPRPPAHLARGTVAVPGSNLRVGPISQTHAATNAFANTHSTSASAIAANAGTRDIGPPASAHPMSNGVSNGVSHGASAAASNRVSSGVSSKAASSNGAPTISGEKGTYRLSNPTAGGRNSFVDRPSIASAVHGEGASRATGYSAAAGHNYGGYGSGGYGGGGYGSSTPGGGSVPRSGPPATVSHAASASASEAHAGGSSGFHGGGGGGGSHGGGGGHR
jgi:hypothetical protein